VAVVAQAERQAQRLGERHLVLHVQRAVLRDRAAAGQPGVVQGLVARLEAGGPGLLAPGGARLAFENAVVQPLRRVDRHARAALVADVEPAAIGAQLGGERSGRSGQAGEARPLRLPADRAQRAVDQVLGDVIAARAAALARVGAAPFAAFAVLGLDAMLGRGLPDEAEPAVVLVAAFEFGDARIGGRCDCGDPAAGHPGAQRETRRERAVGAQRGGVAGAAAVALGPLAAEGGAEPPALARLARDHVHHTAQRLAAVQHRQRPAHDLDALDVIGRDPADLEVGVPDHAVTGSDAAAVDEEQGVLAVQPAQADHLASADRAALQRDAGLAADRVEHGVGAARLDLAARDDRQRRRRVERQHRVARGRHDHALGRRRCSGIVGVGARREQRRGGGHGRREQAGEGWHGLRAW
jgi:hypothetical protein